MNSTVDFSILSYASDRSSGKTSEDLREELQAVNRELASMKKKWQEERGDNIVLKDVANRLNLQMHDAKKLAEQKERRHEEAKTGVLSVWARPSLSGVPR